MNDALIQALLVSLNAATFSITCEKKVASISKDERSKKKPKKKSLTFDSRSQRIKQSLCGPFFRPEEGWFPKPIKITIVVQYYSTSIVKDLYA